MNSKECLERLVGMTCILNDTCASLEKCIKSGKCKWKNESVKTCDAYILVMTIKQDLEKCEKLEKENQELKEQNERLYYKNQKLTKILKEVFENE